MSPVFGILSLVTLASAVAAMSLRNLVHCALCLVATFAGLAGLYLSLDAEFVGLAQILVYVGAVAILIVFAVLLTRNAGAEAGGRASPSWLMGLLVALLVGGTLVIVVAQVPHMPWANALGPGPTVHEIGMKLMTDYVLPLEAIGLLLTAALIGAVIIAMREGRGGGRA